MDTLTVTVQKALEKYTGGSVRVRIIPSGIQFSVDNGPRVPALGGFVGGNTNGTLRKGKIFPDMASGQDPLGAGLWVEVLQPLGWFE